nr:hypothetical protein [Tanacetum cinerariifolium]
MGKHISKNNGAQPPLIETSPTPIPSRDFYYCSTAWMAVRTQPTMSPGISAREGTDSESEEAAFEDQQLAVLTEDIAKDEPSGLGYKAAKHQQIADETVIPRLPVRTTWLDPEDGTVYMDIECDMPPVRPLI